ncbi:MAG: FG-GAP repeat domain-containing protein, partial [Phycisphaerae bacterium]
MAVLLLAAPVAAALGGESTNKGLVLLTDVTAAAGIDFVETLGDDDMTNIVESAGVGCGFLDYNGDGWLDVYLVSGRWLDGLSDSRLDPARRKRLAQATDRLYRNRGDGTFEDVTVQAGLARAAYGMGITAADYDGDGDTDLYVTNYGPNSLYRNNGDGTFTDVARAAGVDDASFSVGATFFDFDRDGRLDLY